VIAVLLFVVGPASRPEHDQQHYYYHAPTVKPEAATAVVELLMMGVRTPKTCCAVNKISNKLPAEILGLNPTGGMDISLL